MWDTKRPSWRKWKGHGASAGEMWTEMKSKRNQSERERERKDTGREKVRWRDEKCSGRGGIYVRVSLAQQGCLLKGSLLRTGGEKGCGYKDGWLNKEPQIALLDCPENQVLKMNFQKTQNYSWLIYQSIQKKKTLNLFPARTTNRLC